MQITRWYSVMCRFRVLLTRGLLMGSREYFQNEVEFKFFVVQSNSTLVESKLDNSYESANIRIFTQDTQGSPPGQSN